MALVAADMTFIRQLVLERSAIALDEKQHYLVEARLLPLAREAGLPDVAALVSTLRNRPFSEQHRRVVEAMTTNETSFFRDIHPFETLRTRVLPKVIESRKAEKKLTIWCAACSTGQEPYSIVMLLRDQFPVLRDWSVRLLASDFSQNMVERARRGRYNALEVGRGLPALCLVKHFDKVGAEWEVKAPLREAVEWFQLNLAGPWPSLPTFDIIFIRNVLIYFKPEIRSAILEKGRRHLAPHGVLFLGTTESTHGLCKSLEPESAGKTTYYRPVGASVGGGSAVTLAQAGGKGR